MRTGTRTRVGAAVTLVMLLAACGTAAPDTEEVALPQGFGQESTAEKSADEEPTADAATGAEPTEDATDEEPTEDAATGAEPTQGDGAQETGAADAGEEAAGATGGPDECFNSSQVDYAEGSPSEAAWGEPVRIDIGNEEWLTLEVAEPVVRESNYRIEQEPDYVWEADVTATNGEGMGFTAIQDYVLLDEDGTQCGIEWADMTLYGLMVYETGDQETGKAAFMVPTDDVNDYRLVYVGYDSAAQASWKN